MKKLRATASANRWGASRSLCSKRDKAFDRRLLIAQATGQLGLDPGLFLNNRAHKGHNPFELVAMCPGEHVRDILGQASSPRGLGCYKPRLARVRTRGYSPPNECVLTSGREERKYMVKRNTQFQCEKCPRTFPSQRELAQHERQCTGKGE